jgi:putative acetyltransferase
MLIIRPETPGDFNAVHALHAAAFPTDAEARLVDLLRARGRAQVSLVAEQDGRVAGHVLFSPITVDDTPTKGVGLAPVAVLPQCQRQGLGSRLITEGLAVCRATGFVFVVVLGEPGYYRRFGFSPAAEKGLGNTYGADDAFMVLELTPGGLPVGGGLVRYAPEFPATRHASTGPASGSREDES